MGIKIYHFARFFFFFFEPNLLIIPHLWVNLDSDHSQLILFRYYLLCVKMVSNNINCVSKNQFGWFLGKNPFFFDIFSTIFFQHKKTPFNFSPQLLPYTLLDLSAHISSINPIISHRTPSPAKTITLTHKQPNCINTKQQPKHPFLPHRSQNFTTRIIYHESSR